MMESFSRIGRSILLKAMYLVSALAIGILVVLSSAIVGGSGSDDPPIPEVSRAVKSDLSQPLRDIVLTPSFREKDPGLQIVSLGRLPQASRENIPASVDSSEFTDPVVQDLAGPLDNMPAPIQNFEGVSSDDNLTHLNRLPAPPDTNGDVGPNHYVQMVNVSFAVWDKAGNLLLGPLSNNALWLGFGGVCQFTNEGDPIVLYDELADRWMMSQFAFRGEGESGTHECTAISQTGDPTGAWYRYDFVMSETEFNDYPKLGVWPDAYYMTTNDFSGFGFAGVSVFAFERDKMLAGAPDARMIKFQPGGGLISMLPSDLDGPAPPIGTPNYVVELDIFSFSPELDDVNLFEFHVDWDEPASSTFTGPTVIDVAPFFLILCGLSFGSDRNCIPQPDTSSGLDVLSARLMHRAQYRNFGSHETLVLNQTVAADGDFQAGIRWHELRDSGEGWELHQEGTYAPADGDHRWMGSIAMDRDGNIALGYSVSGHTTFPSIRYTGRLAGDPLSTLPQGEAELIAGSGPQLEPDRWGDYSMMAVDPTDGCTFWYTQEYIGNSGVHGFSIGYFNWRTRIGSFKFPTCGIEASGALQGTVTDAETTKPIAGVVIDLGHMATITDADGHYQVLRSPVGTFDVAASHYGYTSATLAGVSVEEAGTTTLDIDLEPLQMVAVEGTVTDGSGQGWPLYAHIDVSAPGFQRSLITDPADGQFSLLLAEGTAHIFSVRALGGGYQPGEAIVTPLADGGPVALDLPIDPVSCVAPGYGYARESSFLVESFDDLGTEPPPGWTVINNSGFGQAWRFDDPGRRGNLTGGTGGFAIVDSDFYGFDASDDAELRSPPMDSSDPGTVVLEFDTDYNANEFENSTRPM